MFTIGVRLDPETRYKLEQLARLTGRSRSVLVAEAVRRFVDGELSELIAQAKAGKPEQEDESGNMSERWNLIV